MSGSVNLAKIKEWQTAHPELVKRYKQKWLAENPEKRRQVYLEYWRRLRLAALEAYGRICACCGEGRLEFLAIDHVDGAGNEHRRNVKARSGQNLFNWLKSNGYPSGFRVLCHNCNSALGFYGYCPHEDLRAQKAAA